MILLSRNQAWTYYSSIPLNIGTEVFINIFRLIYDALEKNPDAKLKDIAPQLFNILEKRT